MTADAEKETVAQKGSTKKSEQIDKIIQSIEKMSIMELSELSKALQEKFGVSPAMQVAQAVGPAGGGAPVAEEKTEFDVILSAAGDKKIQVIKVVRELTSLGLKEAKDLVDGAPKPVKEKIPREEAESAKKKLQEVGAKVEIK